MPPAVTTSPGDAPRRRASRAPVARWRGGVVRDVGSDGAARDVVTSDGAARRDPLRELDDVLFVAGVVALVHGSSALDPGLRPPPRTTSCRRRRRPGPRPVRDPRNGEPGRRVGACRAARPDAHPHELPGDIHP